VDIEEKIIVYSRGVGSLGRFQISSKEIYTGS